MSDVTRLLLCACFLPRDPAKSFHALIMKYMARRGWAPTIATVGHPALPQGLADWEGVKVWNFPFHSGYLARHAAWVHHARWMVNRERRWRSLKARSLVAEMGSALLDYPLMALRVVGSFPDGYRPYAGTIAQAVIDAHRKTPWGAVLSIYGPFTNHVIARDVRKATGLPWVALVKDFYSAPRWRTRPRTASEEIRNAVKRAYERRVLGDSSLLVPYTEHMAGYLSALVQGVPVRVLGNCYDPEQFAAPAPTAGEAFDAVCVGEMPLEGLRMLFGALQAFRRQRHVSAERFHVTFVGAKAEIVGACARAHNCEELVRCIPPVPHREAVAYMRKATCLLLYMWEGILPRRFPEYLASRRPILAFPDEQMAPTRETLQRHGAAVIANDTDALWRTLDAWHREFTATGQLAAAVDEDVVRGFDAGHRAAELEGMLRELAVGEAAGKP
jgi:hypothetical protein